MKRFLICLLSLSLLLACVPTPEEDAVKQKDTVATVDFVRSANAEPSEAQAVPVREQMPSHLNWDFYTDAQHVRVTADVPIRILTENRFPLLRCMRKQPTADENLALSKRLLGLDTVYLQVPQYTKADLEREIEVLMNLIYNNDHSAEIWKDHTEEEMKAEVIPRWKQQLETLQEQYRSMPDDGPAPNPVWDGSIDDWTARAVPGPRNTNAQDCDFVNFQVGSYEPKSWDLWYAKAEQFGCFWSHAVKQIDPSAYDTPQDGFTITPNQAIAAVQELLDPFVKTAVNAVRVNDNSSDSTAEDPAYRAEYAYGIYLTPIYHGSAAGVYLSNFTQDVSEENWAVIWNRETIFAAVNDDGILQIIWSEPLTVTEVVAENCPLLPFDEIEALAKRQLNRLTAAEEHANTTLTVTGVTLGLVRIAEPNEQQQALLAPMWCFYGDWIMPDGRNAVPDESWAILMINAIDGTPYNPLIGY